jgi:hypothetical protein
MSAEWQSSTEGMVAASVRAVMIGTSDLQVQSFNPDGYLAICAERQDLELAYRQLGRLLSRLPAQRPINQLVAVG